MSEFAGNLPRKFISFRHLGFESSAHFLPEERESERPQNVAEIDEVNTVVVDEKSNSPAIVMSILQNVPMSSEIITSGVVQKDHDLTFAENGVRWLVVRKMWMICITSSVTNLLDLVDDVYFYVDAIKTEKS